MRRILFAAGALALVALLGACGSPGAGGLAGAAAVADLKVAAAEDEGPLQRAADELLGEAKGGDQRHLRLCMIVTGVTELMADRVTLFDVEYAPAALGQIAALKGALKRVEASGPAFFETDVELATLKLTSVLVDVGKDRVPRLLSVVAGGVNPLGIAERARIAARQAALAGAVVRDAKHLLAEVAAGRVPVEQARADCMARLDANYARISALLGG